MQYKTAIQIVVDAEKELSQVAGTSVQVYAQDNLMSKLQNAFLMVYDDPNVRWRHFETTQTYTLDGTTGHTTVAIKTMFPNFEDVVAIYPNKSVRPLAEWPGGNPSSVAGSYPLFFMRDQSGTDVLKILPSTASATLTVEGKIRPTLPFNPNDTVPFDYMTMVYFIAWQYAVDDGANPGGAEKLRQLFEQRYKQVKIGQDRGPVALNPEYGNLPMTWRDQY